jgi:hypothetical protein
MFTNSASAGAVGRVNEHSGFAVASAHYIVFVELKHARPFRLLQPFDVPRKPHAGNEFAAFIGIDWADAKHVLAGPTPLGESVLAPPRAVGRHPERPAQRRRFSSGPQ